MSSNSQINIYELIYLTRQGDEEAFSMLFQELTGEIWKIYHQLCCWDVNARDWESEAWCTLDKALNRYRHDLNADFRTAFYCFLQSAASDLRRKKNRKYKSSDNNVIPLEYLGESGVRSVEHLSGQTMCNTIEETVLTSITCDQVFASIRSYLDDLDMKILEMYRAGYKARDIAGILGVSKPRLQRARAKAKQAYASLEKPSN